MNKKFLIFGAIALVIASVAYFLIPGEEESIEQTINELPQLVVLRTNGESLSVQEVDEKSILIFFNPDCDHCQREAEQISQQKNVFRDYSLYFISIDAMPAIEKFAVDYKLQDANFIFAQADFNEVYRTVGPLPSVPAIFIYNNKRLVKRLEGEVKIEEVKKYL